MSKTRHPVSRVDAPRKPRGPARPDGPVLVRTHPVTLLHDLRMPAESHDWDQLTYAAAGLMTLETADTHWLVPPHRAVWVPAGTLHAEVMQAPVTVRSLYFARGVTARLPRELRTLEVSPLLRELILHVTKIGSLDRRIPTQARLIAVLLDQMATVSAVPLQLPWPRDARARRIAQLLEASPGDVRPTPALARVAGAGVRTLERAFMTETRMTLGEWRRRCRLLHAMRCLVRGASVTDAALEAGYDSTSAFVSAFKRLFGVTPGRYAGQTRK